MNKKRGRATAGLELLSMTVPRLSYTVPKGSGMTVNHTIRSLVAAS